ncbi:ABI gene family member 3 isoform X2 [Xenopus laevis]|uniref:ABI gene family member 3 isoform X2 n=1 Tax=Xenopus laevis TaxID=8355 RepID=A0A8J1LXQ3_XENLA|nr:ABI gene family member 3 isoform X2 [Xenopus laevis]
MSNMRPENSSKGEAQRHSPGEITAVRQALRDSYTNLHNVADYCEKNYMEASDKKKALQDTMSLVTQTLASVASHVGLVAREMLLILQEQSQILHQHENRVRNISQLVDIRVEKASRQKIGPLTCSKKKLHTQKILSEGNQAPRPAYIRSPINSKILDQTGHGITESDSRLSKTGTMSHRTSFKSLTNSQGTLGRSLRIIDPVLPPQIPEMTPSTTPPVWNSTSPNVDTTIMEQPLSPPPVVPQEPFALLQDENHIANSTSNSLLDFCDPGLPPPPPSAHEETNNTSWEPENEPSFPVYPESLESLPPPPPPADI